MVDDVQNTASFVHSAHVTLFVARVVHTQLRVIGVFNAKLGAYGTVASTRGFP